MSDALDGQGPVPDLRLRGDPPQVMRLSRKALTVLALLASAGIGGSLIYALRPAHRAPAEELYKTDSHTTADTLASAPKDYGDVPKLGPPLPGDLGRPIVTAQARGAEVPPAQTGPVDGSRPGPVATARQAARQRIGQERESARVSTLFLGGGARSDASSDPGVPVSNHPDAVASAPSGGPASPAQGADSDQRAKRAFLSGASTHTFVSANRLEQPASPYILQAGSVIAAALITGIRSDLPGQITAQVTQNIYDSPTGRLLLIPQGAKLIGEYDSQISFGQNRLLLAWDRLILPDGQSVVLDRLPGTDAAGYAGLQDRTNQHWGGIVKAALVSTVLGIGSEVGSNNDDDLTRAIRRGTSDTVNQAGQQIVRRQLTVQPTLTIRPGYPVHVIVVRDIILSPTTVGAR